MESFILKIEESCVVCKIMSNFDDTLHLLWLIWFAFQQAVLLTLLEVYIFHGHM